MRLADLNHPQLFLVHGRGEQIDVGIAGGVLDVALVHLNLQKNNILNIYKICLIQKEKQWRSQ